MGKFLEDCAGELILYVRQQAWLDSTPDRAPENKSPLAPMSRLEALSLNWAAQSEEGKPKRLKEDYEPEFPPLDDDLRYLIRDLYDFGPVMSNGMGTSWVPYSEITFWKRETGKVRDVWETETLQKLSRAYSSEYSLGSRRDRPPPYRAKKDSDTVSPANDTKEAIRALAGLNR